MCRLLAYLGPTIPLDRLIHEPDHSLVVQSYQPKEMDTALLNADGFGLGWYAPERRPEPFTYRNTAPIWNDINLPQLTHYIHSGCWLAYVRSATPGLAVDLQNCQPFTAGRFSLIHNGFIERFRHTLYRPLREGLSDRAYHAIHGLTDSEHIFARLLHEIDTHPGISLEAAMQNTLGVIATLAAQHQVRAAINLVVSDGQRLVACRFDTTQNDLSLYWLQSPAQLPGSVVLASEPLFDGNWVSCPPATIVTIAPNGTLQTLPIHHPNSSVLLPTAF